MVAQTVGFAILMVYVVRPVVAGWARRAIERGGASCQ
jgi:hypothetical protein